MVTPSRLCSSCQAVVLPEDRFCPGCGNALVETSTPAAIDLVTCLECGANHEPYLNFCSICGNSLELAREKLRQQKLQELQKVQSQGTKFSLQTIRKVIASTSELTNSTAALPPPIKPPVTNTAKSKVRAPMVVNRTFDLSLIAVILGFSLMAVWWQIDLQQKQSPTTGQELFNHAKSELAAGHFDAAITKFERLSQIAQASDMPQEQQQSFGEALSRRAKLFAEKQNWKSALFDLLRISPAYAGYRQSRQQIKLALAHQALPDETAPVVSAIASPSGSDIKPVATAAQKNPVPEATAVVPISKPEIITSKVQRPERVLADLSKAPKSKGSIVITTVRGNYNDADITHYHELLAEYFSRGATTEPPTFKEWLDKNKVEF
jgi:hypothetical protein